LNADLYDEVIEEASNRFRKWSTQGVRGQMIMPQDGIEYWIIEVATEMERERCAKIADAHDDGSSEPGPIAAWVIAQSIRGKEQ